MYELPISLNGCEIRGKGDYRAVLDAISALNNQGLNTEGLMGNERVYVAMNIFYEDLGSVKNYQDAWEAMCQFINLGQETDSKNHVKKLYDWEQDSHMITAAVSKVYGQPIRSIPYLHWWDFVSAFFEIGEGQFSFVCSIREKIKKGKKLEKHEREFRDRHPEILFLQNKVSEEEQQMIDEIFGERR